MRALASVDGGVVKAEIEITAPPERVFKALTNAAELAAWWGAHGMYHTTEWQIDLRPGGKWSTVAINADGSRSTVGGEYLEIDPPRLLVHTWRPSWDDFMETTIRYDLQPTATGTRVLVTHSGFGDRAEQATGTGEGWRRVLDWLGEFLAESR